MPPSLTLLLTLTSLLRAAAGDVRRVLHEPLFPVEWTPPPSPPAPPAPDFSSDPSTPAPPDNGGPALLPPSATPAPPPPPNTVAADVSSSRSGPTQRLRGGGTPKAAIVVASAGAAAVLALLAFAAAFLLTGRLARHPAQPHKPPAPAHHGPTTTVVGPIDAAGPAAVAGSSTVCPYRMVRAERVRRGMCRDVDTVPSPELRPLPPLRRGASAAPGSSDEDAACYTPGHRSAGSGGGEGGGTWSEASASSPRTTTASRRSLPSLTSDFC